MNEVAFCDSGPASTKMDDIPHYINLHSETCSTPRSSSGETFREISHVKKFPWRSRLLLGSLGEGCGLLHFPVASKLKTGRGRGGGTTVSSSVHGLARI